MARFDVHMAAAVPTAVLGKALCSLAHRRDDIVAAIDFPVTGI